MAINMQRNVDDGAVYSWYARKEGGKSASLTNYSHIFVGKNKIYDNGGSEIYKQLLEA